KLPDVPQTKLDEPLAQCGVLYLGTATPAAGLRGLDSVQEPLSKRYPVDGTNTVKGIDAIVTVYEDGIQLQFARHPYIAIFYPITSLVYCASLRYAVVDGDPNKQFVSSDWYFAPLDALQSNKQSKHPPIFCTVFQRSQVLTGEECHCFITKSDDASLALVKALSTAYTSVDPALKSLKSPIFYQLDRYGRKLTETNGMVYLLPADGIRKEKRNSIFDPRLDGYFYKTDTAIIEVWQLWDEDNVVRPKPPPSPFGHHQGIYHDDTINEINTHLKNMDDKEEKRSCSCSSRSSSRTSSSDSSYQALSRPTSSMSKRLQRRRLLSKSLNDDNSNPPFSYLQTSSFEPILIDTTPKDSGPVIIEKYISERQNPESIQTHDNFQAFLNDNNSSRNGKYRHRRKKYILEQPTSKKPLFVDLEPSLYQSEEQQIQYTHANTSMGDRNNFQINEKGDRITSNGNRIIFMDVVTPDLHMKRASHSSSKNHRLSQQRQIPTTTTPYASHPHRHEYQYNELPVDNATTIVRKKRSSSRLFRKKSHRHRIPVIDIENIEHLLESPNNTARVRSPLMNEKRGHDSEIVDGYFEDSTGKTIKLNRDDAESMLAKLHKGNHHASTIPSINSSKGSNIRHGNYSATVGSTMTYAERSSDRVLSKSLLNSRLSTIMNSQYSSNNTQEGVGNNHVTQYVGTMYSTSQRERLKSRESKQSISSNSNDNQIALPITPALFQATNNSYISPFHYMQSSINPSLLREYRLSYA
ncbi:unnamed protein product, partial [Didymodactylos carnosus]